MLRDKQVNATTHEVKDKQVASYQNKRIFAAIYEFKDKDIDYVKEYFSNKNKETKVLAVSNRSDLMNALGNQNNQTAKTIYISGTIDMNIGSNGKILTAADYANGTAIILLHI